MYDTRDTHIHSTLSELADMLGKEIVGQVTLLCTDARLWLAYLYEAGWARRLRVLPGLGSSRITVGAGLMLDNGREVLLRGSSDAVSLRFS